MLGVAGLILPRLLGVAETLTGLAALSLAVVMLGAMSMHAKLAITEHRNALVNVVLLLQRVSVAVGRI
ncbi:hypothetical protein TUM20985_39320 [Mycobacterium antarcticum]|uniref:DoxX family protein n=1 Tax=unclassified Mycolicibacterium TaxID=2636767 RepID=UPI0023955260|nr:hypothetical protein TUM20985_39320 [Mycolicibacterium sp. TUM20985]GLP83044.1 hypothetical protein TUM20984_44640 [Mycolicibacterium sp. TUM20984]